MRKANEQQIKKRQAEKNRCRVFERARFAGR
jgi:hypothetical protein